MLGNDESRALIGAHLRAGWYGLACFIALGIALEVMLAFEWRGYVDVESQERRLLLRLGHAHGTLLSLLQLAFAFTLSWLDTSAARRTARVASVGLGTGLLLVPLGFLLGGALASESDPAPGILLVPLGAVALLVGVVAAALLPRQP